MKFKNLLNELEIPGLREEDKKLTPGQWATAANKITEIFQAYRPLSKFRISANLEGSMIKFRSGSTMIGKININQITKPEKLANTQLEEII